ncbi:hypothetical protein [Streptomyces sp. NPDC048665]|uniref:hypothetical protein n=1 Tax=Streptomyces sp. NPDC048665 TaxID=3155490 RepID=UPI0034225544
MKKKWPVPRPTEHAALRNLGYAPRDKRPQVPYVPALMAALIDAVAQQDREGICLSSHRVVRATAPEVGR